ncbi:MAG: nitronate monooxygenase [Burkholderiales bacterium]|nr:nitronate monooxygenase [Burkholderiales bacterium]
MSVPHSIRTWLTERLGVRYPIIQAPMAGGPTTAELVAAVGNAGALGSLGLAYAEPAAMRAQVEAVRALTPAPIHINLFVENAPAPPSTSQMRAALAALEPMYAALGIAAPRQTDAPFAPDLDAQVQAAIALRPAVLSTHFRQLTAGTIAELRARNILVAACATNLAEARHVESLGVDFIIAQGAEAGGHRGTFIGAAEDSMIGTMALVRTLVRECSLPVVAAGGIMDGAGLAAALALGACAVQMGTAFLPVEESGASEAHKQALFERTDAGTTITRAFSGRPARGIRNAFIERAATEHFPLLPFPIQNKATAPLRAAAAKQGNADFLSLWAGQGYTLARRMRAADLVRTLAEEYDEASQALLRAMRG